VEKRIKKCTILLADAFRAFASNYALEEFQFLIGAERKRGSLKIVNRTGQATCCGLTSSVYGEEQGLGDRPYTRKSG
jgi:hypothetical protein